MKHTTKHATTTRASAYIFAICFALLLLIPSVMAVSATDNCTHVYGEDHVCTLCDTPYSSKNHSYKTADYVVTKEATCAEAGSKTGSCYICGYERTVTISKLPHTLAEDAEITKEPTCTKSGTRTGLCTVCNNESATETIPKTGHTYVGEPTVITPATCNSYGQQTQHCSTCDKDITDSKVAKTAHTYGEDHYCTACGKKSGTSFHKYTVEGETHTCTVCGKVVEGHTYSQSTHKCTLSGCGLLHEAGKTHTYDTATHACSVCGRIANNGEHMWWGDWEAVTEVSCTQDGVYRRYCYYCDAYDEMIIEGGHGHKTLRQPTKNQITAHYSGPHMIGNDTYTVKLGGEYQMVNGMYELVGATTVEVDRSENRDKAILYGISCNHCGEFLLLNIEFEGTWGEYGEFGEPRKPLIENRKILDQGYGSRWWYPLESATWTLPADTYTGWELYAGDTFLPANFDVTLPWLPFTVTFVDYDGTVLKEESVMLEQESTATSAKWIVNGATAPETPERAGYKFTGWDKAFDRVTSDLTVTAQYKLRITEGTVTITKVVSGVTPEADTTYTFMVGDQDVYVIIKANESTGSATVTLPLGTYEVQELLADEHTVYVSDNYLTDVDESATYAVSSIDQSAYFITLSEDEPAVSVTVTNNYSTVSVETEPVETEPVETEPVETEPVETEPVETEPVETEPVETEPVEVIDDEEVPLTDIPDEPVPLTGITAVWGVIALVSGAGIGVVTVARKKQTSR